MDQVGNLEGHVSEPDNASLSTSVNIQFLKVSQPKMDAVGKM